MLGKKLFSTGKIFSDQGLGVSVLVPSHITVDSRTYGRPIVMEGLGKMNPNFQLGTQVGPLRIGRNRSVSARCSPHRRPTNRDVCSLGVTVSEPSLRSSSADFPSGLFRSNKFLIARGGLDFPPLFLDGGWITLLRTCARQRSTQNRSVRDKVMYYGVA